MIRRVALVAVLAFAVTTATAGEPPRQPPAWVSTMPFAAVERFVERVPFRFAHNKIWLEVALGGKPRRFVFDTGSPTLLDTALAEELGLEIVDRIVGTDAHGAKVENGIAILDALTLGELTIHDVPVMVHDLSRTSIGGCLVDGVLGSEILPVGNWRIDVAAGIMTIANDRADLPIADGAEIADLHVFGYPYTPYFDMLFENGMESKAMFDTGSAEMFALCPPELESLENNKRFRRQLRIHGYGSIGESLGGAAPDAELTKVRLQQLEVGGVALGEVVATLRPLAPSLLGADVLRHFVVTLAYPERKAYFERRDERPRALPTFGFGPAFSGETVTAAFVWEGSPAWRAGLRAGDRVTRIDDIDLGTVPPEGKCELVRQVLEVLGENDGVTLSFVGEGGAATVRVTKMSPDLTP